MHPLLFDRTSKFYSRNSAGKYQLDVHEIRNAFGEAESIERSLKSWHTDRLARIISDDLPVELSFRSRIVLHVCPTLGFSGRFRLDPVEHFVVLSNELRPMNNMGHTTRITFEGLMLLTHAAGGFSQVASYAQIFRNGCVEAVDAATLMPWGNQEEKWIPRGFESRIVEALGRYLKLLFRLEIEGPLYAFLTMTNVKGYTVGTGQFPTQDTKPVYSDHLILPGAYLENTSIDAGSLLRSSFDQIWNACGLLRSRHYNDQGEFRSAD